MISNISLYLKKTEVEHDVRSGGGLKIKFVMLLSSKQYIAFTSVKWNRPFSKFENKINFRPL
jgi:hypothetical protein